MRLDDLMTVVVAIAATFSAGAPCWLVQRNASLQREGMVTTTTHLCILRGASSHLEHCSKQLYSQPNPQQAIGVASSKLHTHHHQLSS